MDSFYAIWRTLDDPGASRAGMVRSHVALVDLMAVGELLSLDTIVGHLPVELQAEPFDQAFDVARDEAANPALGPRYDSLCEQLVRADRSGPVIVPDEGDWEGLLTTLWSFLWPEARRRLACFHANGPEAVPSSAATILVTPRAATNKWGGYALIDIARSPSDAARLLTGTPGSVLSRLRDELGTMPPDLRMLGLLERTAGMLMRCESNAMGIAELKTLLEAIVRLAPGPDSATALKAKLCERIARALRDAPIGDVLALSNLEVFSAGVAMRPLEEALRSWVNLHVVRAEAKQAATLVKRLADNRLAVWWRGAIRDGLRSLIAQGALSTWEAMWSWSVSRAEVLPELMAEVQVTDDAEPLAARACPRALPLETAQAGIAFSRARGWPRVHAAIVASAFPARQALELQLAFPHQPRGGLSVLLDRLDGRDLAELAVEFPDEELIRRGAGALVAAPGLLSALDVANPGWRALWLRALTNGLAPWSGVSEPTAVAAQLLLEVARGTSVDTALLLALSSNLPRVSRVPAGLWGFVKEPARSALARAIAAQWLMSLGTGDELALDRAAVPAAIELFASRVSERTLPIDLLPRILDVSGERGFVSQLLEGPNVAVPASIAREVGVRIARWSDSALAGRAFARWRRGWRELEPVLIECVGLLPFWDRVAVPSQQVPSHEDVRTLIAELRRILSDLYPEGPLAHVWGDAGGRASMLPIANTGAERWAVALEQVARRASGTPRLARLIEVVRREFPDGAHAERLALIERWLARA